MNATIDVGEPGLKGGEFISLPQGDIHVRASGTGPAALFIHGFPLNGLHWRYQFHHLADIRRCIAPDLLGLGETRPSPGAPLDFGSQADMLLHLLDALDIERADVVGNDSGAAIAQLLSVRAPDRVRTLCITNGDTHDNYPPPAFQPAHQLALAGQLGEALAASASNAELLRSGQGLGAAFEHPDRLSEDLISAYIQPLAASAERRAMIDSYVAAMDNRQMTAVRDQLEKLDISTLIVWGNSDVFFDLKWAHWLAETLPRTRLEVLEGAHLFFPEERAEAFSALLRGHWTEAV